MSSQPHILLARDVATGRDEISALPGFLEAIRPACELSDEQFFNLVVAMTEAVNNAVVHGNALDPSKRVRYRIEKRDAGVLCTIEDEGEGFELDDVADPISPENLLREGGRGMFLIGALMRDLSVENTGSGTRVEFFCPRG